MEIKWVFCPRHGISATRQRKFLIPQATSILTPHHLNTTDCAEISKLEILLPQEEPDPSFPWEQLSKVRNPLNAVFILVSYSQTLLKFCFPSNLDPPENTKTPLFMTSFLNHFFRGNSVEMQPKTCILFWGSDTN